MAARFIQVDRDTPYIMPPSVQDWLAQDHLARFVVDVVSQLDLSKLAQAYGGRGSAAYPPSVLLGLLIYGYATGVYSSRGIERATYDSVAFRYIAGNTHPDHDTINRFRRLFWEDHASSFRQVLQIAAAAGLLKLGTISLDGTKIKANASKHSALSYGHAQQLEMHIEAQIAEIKRRAEMAEPLPDGLSVPKELEHREERLAVIRKAKAQIEARAAERDAAATAEYDAKVQRRQAQRDSGKNPKGPDPQPPACGPKDRDQVNLTDEESRILPSSSGFVQGYNAQAAVDADTLLIVACDCVQAANDKQQIEPMLAPLQQLPQALGNSADQPTTLLADTGYFSATNVQACADAGIAPLIAEQRESHSSWLDRQLETAPELPAHPSALEKMRHRRATTEGRAIYAKRKCTVEPVFGIIKQVMRFRQFMVRGLKQVKAEWGLVCLAFNIKRLAVLMTE